MADEVVAHLPPRARPHQLQEILRVIGGTKVSLDATAPLVGTREDAVQRLSNS